MSNQVPNKRHVDVHGWMYDFTRAYYSPYGLIDAYLNTLWEVANWPRGDKWRIEERISACERDIRHIANVCKINMLEVNKAMASVRVLIVDCPNDHRPAILSSLHNAIERLEKLVGPYSATRQTHPHTTYTDASASAVYQWELDRRIEKEAEKKSLAQYAQFIQDHRKTMTSSIKSCDSDIQRLLDLTQRTEKNEATFIEIGRVLHKLETRLENSK